MSKMMPIVLSAALAGKGGGGSDPRIGDMSKLRTEHKDTLVNAINDIEMAKFPNMTIFGEPTIQQGQVSDFSDLNYMEFPFLVDFRGRSFEINFAFTTSDDIDSQQNILDSEYGLAFAIRDKHVVLALSINGTSWLTEQSGQLELQTNTTYRYRISWNGLLYKVSYSFDGGNTYIDDLSFGQSEGPYPKQTYIGVSKLSDNYFKGSINLNYANLKISDEIVWQGMDDVGLATRLATDLSNIDDAGTKRIKDIAEDMDQNSLGVYYWNLSNITTSFSTTSYLYTMFLKAINIYLRNKNIKKINAHPPQLRIYFQDNNGKLQYVDLVKMQGPTKSGDYTSYGFVFHGTLGYDTSVYGVRYRNFYKLTMPVWFKTDEGEVGDVKAIYSSSSEATVFRFTTADDVVTPIYGQTLAVNNTAEYNPTSNYHPATKKYVDDAISNIPTPSGGESLLSKENNTYLLKAGIRLDMRGSYNDETLLAEFSRIMTDLYPKKTADVDASALLFIKDYTGWSDGIDAVARCGFSEFKFYYTIPYYGDFAHADWYNKYGYIEPRGSWDETTKTYTCTAIQVFLIDFVPTKDYHPANKKYVDDAIAALKTELGI